MLLDTGSYYTVIKPWVADELELDFDSAPVERLFTGSDVVQVPVLTLAQVEVGDVVL